MGTVDSNCICGGFDPGVVYPDGAIWQFLSLSLSLGANGKKVPKTRRDIFLSCPPELTFCKLPINKRTYTNKTERIQHPFEYN